MICEVETDKATMDYESHLGGHAAQDRAARGRPGEGGRPHRDRRRARARTSPRFCGAPRPPAAAAPAAAKPAAAPAPAAAPLPTPAQPTGPAGRLRSSPLARRLADERGIDLGSVSGTGPAGRVVKRDIDAAVPVGQPRAAVAAALPDLPLGPGDELEPLSGMRRVIAQRLSESKFTAPHFYLTVVVEADELLAFRARLNSGDAPAADTAGRGRHAEDLVQRDPRGACRADALPVTRG